jgi:hypothetical protein
MRVPGVHYVGPERRESTSEERAAYRERNSVANGNGDPKVTLSVNHVVMTIFVGLLMWATSLIWAKADGAASKQDLRTIEERTVGL